MLLEAYHLLSTYIFLAHGIIYVVLGIRQLFCKELKSYKLDDGGGSSSVALAMKGWLITGGCYE